MIGLMGKWLWGIATVAAFCALSTATGQAAGLCPNEAVRSGPSAALPDCRAYELVTPGDSNGRLLRSLPDRVTAGDIFPTEPVTSDGESFIFSTRAAPLLTPSGANGMDQGRDGYEAQRTVAGWQVVRLLTPSGAESVDPEAGGVSSDHRYIFINAGPVLDEGATYYGNLYEEGGADYLGEPDGTFEPTGLGSLGTEHLAEGRYISPGGGHVIFTTGKAGTQSIWCSVALSTGRPCAVKQLEPNGPPSGTGAVYDRAADGPTRVVSLLPGNVPPAAGEEAFYQGVSKDGTVVAFKIKGTLYVRVDNTVTEKVTEAESEFGGLSEDGRYLFYVDAGNIHRFDTETKVDVVITSTGDGRMVNVSADGSRVYFLSKEQLDGPEGAAGQPNIYVWSGGSPEYVATVETADAFRLGNWTTVISPLFREGGSSPGANFSRTTPDGRSFIFVSGAQLTSYDNSGYPEIYLFEAGQPLACVSCNPELSPATAGARLQDPAVATEVAVVRNLSEDGARVFFETTEALVEGDEDGINDIYEWHRPAGGGGTDVSLISSGKSIGYAEFIPGFQDPNVLMGITPDGGDVFFRSTDALVPSAGLGGVQAIYDARVDGGFAQPSTPGICGGESCRGPAGPAPSIGTAASSGLQGAGNVRPRKKHRKHRCRHSKRKRCSRKHPHPHGRGARASSAPAGAAPSESPASSTSSPSAPPAASQVAAAPTVSAAEFERYGIKSVSAKVTTTDAARHPDFTTTIIWKDLKSYFSPQTENVAVTLPPGLYGNPNAMPRCSTGDFISGGCSPDAQVGFSQGESISREGGHSDFVAPVFNLEPPHPDAEVARLGLGIPFFPVFVDVSVRTASDYRVVGTVHGAPAAFPLRMVETTFWGNPADAAHDEQRLTYHEAFECRTACEAPGGKRESGIPPAERKAYLTNPSACEAQEAAFSITSYEFPGETFSASTSMGSTTNCEGLPFEPTFEAHPTTQIAGAPTGLKTSLRLPQTSSPDEPGTATMREARVTLPEGMTISSSAADGLGACSDAEVHFHEELGAQCPDASKLGTATIVSPVLPRALQGTLYQRTPQGKGHLFGIWLVSDDLGLHVKLPGEIQPDPNTGQLTAVFSDLPQVPVEEIDFDIWGGPRAPLKNPDTCGTYSTGFSFAPHSNDSPVNGQAQMTIDEGCGAPDFSPQLKGGATKPIAGAFSPFMLDLSRQDSEQDLSGVEVILPEGELAKLKGVSLCPDGAAASGACPADSRIGTLAAEAGPGPNPLWLPQPGKDQPALYLAGPYKGAPYSAVSVVPAQAGPFDLGNVVVRSALALNPETAQVTVKTDPLPQLIEGVPVIYRRLHIVVDRPEFTLNPTDCSELAITSNVSSTAGAVAHPSDRFQVDRCKRLRFNPKLSLQLKGGTKRADYPALKAVLKARKGDANLGRVSVALPHSEFLAQEHINTICTRARFAADNCPSGSIYGKAKAWTPLLDEPLEGPVYLRSSSHPLPDLVMDLRGQIEIVVPGRIDSVNGGIRTNFAAVPDAPITKFVLKMKGGKKGLLTNSQNICLGEHRATVKMKAQNGRLKQAKPSLQTSCK